MGLAIEFEYLQTEEITNKIKRCRDSICQINHPCKQDLLNNTKIKIIGSATSGTDHIDQKYLKK